MLPKAVGRIEIPGDPMVPTIQELLADRRSRTETQKAERSPRRGLGALIGALMDPVSCGSCVSWMYSVIAAETHETIHTDPVYAVPTGANAQYGSMARADRTSRWFDPHDRTG